MKKFLFVASVILFFSSPVTVLGEEFPIVCEMREVLNFKRPVQIIFLRVDMKNKTVNGIPGEVLGDDIIKYETETESLTIVLPTMDITFVRRGKGPDNSDVRFTGICYHDKLIF